MGRLVLVDAWNVLHRLEEAPTDEPDDARRWLVARTLDAVARLTMPGGVGLVELVFDSREDALRTGRTSREGTVRWTYAHGSADEAIVERVRDSDGRAEGRRILVVTDDRELARRVRQLGATTRGVCPSRRASGRAVSRLRRNWLE